MRRSLTATRVSSSDLSEAGQRRRRPLALLAAREPPERLHHLLHFLELLQQLVDVARRHAAAVGDPQAPRAVDDRRVASFLRRHRPDDRLDPGELTVVDLGLLELLRDARE